MQKLRDFEVRPVTAGQVRQGVCLILSEPPSKRVEANLGDAQQSSVPVQHLQHRLLIRAWRAEKYPNYDAPIER